MYIATLMKLETKNESHMQFLKEMEGHMEPIRRQLSGTDKVIVINKHVKSTVAEWFSIVQDKVDTNQEPVTLIKTNRY